MNKKISSSIAFLIIITIGLVFGYFVWLKASIILNDPGYKAVPFSKKISFKKEKIVYNNANTAYNIEYTYPVITKGLNLISKDKINQSLRLWAITNAQNQKKDFDKDVINYKSDEKWLATNDIKLIYSLENFPILNVVFSSYTYTGGAHGSHNVSVLIFNTDTGEKISSQNLFKEGYLQKLSSLSFDVLKKNNTQNHEILYGDEMMVKDGLKPTADNFSNFVLARDGIHIIFDEYQVGPYVSGSPEIVLPYRAIQDVMTDSFKKLISIKNISTVESTQKWKTYTNSEHRFSVDYPSGWKTDQVDNLIGFMPSTKVIDESYKGEWQIIINKKTDSPLDVLLDEFGFDTNPPSKKIENITVNGRNAILVKSTLEDGSIIEAVSFENNDSRIVLIGIDEDDGLFKKFYSSFNFYSVK